METYAATRVRKLKERGIAMLTFMQLRMANVQRDGAFNTSHWELAHWFCALIGEVGEAANIVKKIDRGDFTIEQARGELADELADIQTYLDLIAYKAGIDLAMATTEKFNKVSNRIGSSIYLKE